MTQVVECRKTVSSQLYAQLERLAARVEPQVVDWRHHLDRHREPSPKSTAQFVADRLRALQLDEVQAGVAGVVGVLKGGGGGDRVMALRADLADGRGCRAAMLLGAATVLSQLRDRLPGTVLFVFQPAATPADIPAEPRATMVYGLHDEQAWADAALLTGVRLHATMAVDHLGAAAAPA